MRKFGEQTKAELAEARAAATEAIEKYGDFQQSEVWDRFRRNGIWNDHAAVQSALIVIMRRNDEAENSAEIMKKEGLLGPTDDYRVRVKRAFDTLIRAIEREGYSVLVDPDGNYSIEQRTDEEEE